MHAEGHCGPIGVRRITTHTTNRATHRASTHVPMGQQPDSVYLGMLPHFRARSDDLSDD